VAVAFRLVKLCSGYWWSCAVATSVKSSGGVSMMEDQVDEEQEQEQERRAY
jgi:hypothetical protein